MRENVGVKRAGHEMGRGMKNLLGAQILDFSSLPFWPQALSLLTMGLKGGVNLLEFFSLTLQKRTMQGNLKFESAIGAKRSLRARV